MLSEKKDIGKKTQGQDIISEVISECKSRSRLWLKDTCVACEWTGTSV